MMKTLVVALIVALVLAVLLWHLRGDDPPEGQIVEVATVPVIEHHDRTEVFDAPIPVGLPASDVRGVVTISPAGGDSTGTLTGPIRIFIPEDEDEPPRITGLPGSVEVVYTKFEDPFFRLDLHLFLGADADLTRGVSVLGGFSVLEIGSRLYIGAAADRFGLGPFVDLELWREFGVVGKYNLLPFDNESTAIQLGVAYRF